MESNSNFKNTIETIGCIALACLLVSVVSAVFLYKQHGPLGENHPAIIVWEISGAVAVFVLCLKAGWAMSDANSYRHIHSGSRPKPLTENESENQQNHIVAKNGTTVGSERSGGWGSADAAWEARNNKEKDIQI